MQLTSILLLVLLAISGFCQVQNDKLQDYKNDLIHRIKILQDSLSLANNQINAKILANLDKIDHVDAMINNSYTSFFSDVDINNKWGKIPDSAIVKIIDVYGANDRFFKIEYENRLGYILSLNVKITPEITAFFETKKQKIKKENEERNLFKKEQIQANDKKFKAEIDKKLKIENENKRVENLKIKKENENKRIADLAVRNQNLTDLYGATIATRLINKEIWIGMTKDMAIESCGVIFKNNRSVGSWGVHEQWVYSSRTLYFENGKLTSWQD